jgi:hypothetical protein
MRVLILKVTFVIIKITGFETGRFFFTVPRQAQFKSKNACGL